MTPIISSDTNEYYVASMSLTDHSPKSFQ